MWDHPCDPTYETAEAIEDEEHAAPPDWIDALEERAPELHDRF